MTKPPELRPDHHRSFGRRRGRKLRPNRQALIDGHLPVLRLDPADPKLSDPLTLFPEGLTALRMEVGFGAGEHIAAQAEANPATAFIGCEPFVDGVAALLAKIDENAITNIRLLDDDARPLMAALPDGCLERFTLLFPDPWPKARHAHRRFLQEETVAGIARLLAPGGMLHVASDHAPYISWALFHVLNNAAFEWTARRAEDWRNRPEGSIQTRYEKKRKSGGAPVHLIFRRS
ncbi:MAG: tRNA (guanosine(46)-N7)-methyltransferase TrmB [Magnetovibrionaceae bacterium]